MNKSECRQCGEDRTGKGSLITRWGGVFCDELCQNDYSDEVNRLNKIRTHLGVILNTFSLVKEHHNVETPIFCIQEISRMLGQIAGSALTLQSMILSNDDDLRPNERIMKAEKEAGY